jgi:Tetratricopeptide Repeats-Sensor
VPSVAFMVMPFNRKSTNRAEDGVPNAVDFDALWDKVYVPVLKDVGYQPIRADQDIGGLIITEMIQRLTAADLVVADVTLPNANVYYEIGIRHAARRTGCVLFSADWASPVFDLAQIRQVRFPLDDGDVADVTAERAVAAVTKGLTSLMNGTSPVFDSVPGFPDGIDEADLSAFRDVVDELSAFHAEAKAVGLAPPGRRRAMVEAIISKYGQSKVVRESVVMRLVRLLRDHVGWAALLAYIQTLPSHIAQHPSIVEQRCLALAKADDPALAAGHLDELIKRFGGTSERYGLLGGRYKQLEDQADHDADRRRYLDLAITSYELGMRADLNDYYPASNLPRLYRKRGRDGDERRAAEAEVVAMAGCRRAVDTGRDDEWTRPTLLGLAFDRGDLDAIAELVQRIEVDGALEWQMDTTIADLRRTTATSAETIRSQLEGYVERLAALIAVPTTPTTPTTPPTA